VRTALLSILVAVLLVAGLAPGASASDGWCDTDPVLLITTPGGSQVPVFVNTGAWGAEHLPAAQIARIGYTATPKGSDKATAVTVTGCGPAVRNCPEKCATPCVKVTLAGKPLLATICWFGSLLILLALTVAGLLLVAEAWTTDGELTRAHPGKVGDDVLVRLHQGRDATPAALASGRPPGPRRLGGHPTAKRSGGCNFALSAWANPHSVTRDQHS